MLVPLPPTQFDAGKTTKIYLDQGGRYEAYDGGRDPYFVRYIDKDDCSMFEEAITSGAFVQTHDKDNPTSRFQISCWMRKDVAKKSGFA